MDEYESRKPSSVCMGDINLFLAGSISLGAVRPFCGAVAPTGFRLSVFDRDRVVGPSFKRSLSLFDAVLPILCSACGGSGGTGGSGRSSGSAACGG